MLELEIFGLPVLRDKASDPIPSEERFNPAPSEETLGPNEISGSTGSILRSTSTSSGGTGGSLVGVCGVIRVGIGGVLVVVGGDVVLVVGVGDVLLPGAGDPGTIIRSGAPSVISAPNDTSGSVGSVCVGVGESIFEVNCVGVSMFELGGESKLEVDGESTLEVGCINSEGECEGAEGEGEVDGVDIAVE